MSAPLSLHESLQAFAASVKEKSDQFAVGGAEEQLRAPFERFMREAAAALGADIVCTGEAPLPDRLGRPDYAVHLNRLLVGYVELKAPGVGADSRRFKGRNREQFKRFASVPNMLYSDGNEWALYRNGERRGKAVRLSGDILAKGSDAVAAADAEAAQHLLADFLSWDPHIPLDSAGRVELKGFAELLAPLCRMLRDDVAEALGDSAAPLAHLAQDWRRLLFPDASDKQFADAYAQTVAFALLLARSEGADPLTLESAEKTLDAQHSLLSRALQILTDKRARSDIAASLDLLLRVIAVLPPTTFAGVGDPWLYFYEDFLAEYDPQLRKDAGVYYTPVEVVRAQVRLIDHLLGSHIWKHWGFASEGVVTMDPAVGTGTYLLAVIERTLDRIGKKAGPGAIPGLAADLARSLYGFELMVGPYAVAELRVSRALADRGASLSQTGGVHIYLTDTLESPNAELRNQAFWLQPISEQRDKALEIKKTTPVMVCLGNPPYDRHEAATESNKARTGNWVRWGDGKDDEKALLSSFIDPVKKAGRGGSLANLYNQYVYFWRWALWKAFEQKSDRPGVVSFISASSYLDGLAFGGMREHMRRLCDEIWIIDLGGEGRGTRKSENVFDIQTPVAIGIALRADKARAEKPEPTNPTFFDPSRDEEKPVKPARVHYARIEGTRKEKLAALDRIEDFDSIQWRECAADWQAPFRPPGKGEYFALPLLTDLMPWQLSGVKAGRTWPISPQRENLEARWRALMRADKEARKQLFKDSSSGREADRHATQLPPSNAELKPIVDLAKEHPAPHIVRFSYRSFDRQFIFADARLLDGSRPDLWRAHSKRQIYLTRLFPNPIGPGPAVTACADVPDLHHFRGSYGGKDIIPLYCSADASSPNIAPGLFDRLERAYKRVVTPEDFIAYIYGVAAHPAFAALFASELETRELRIPLTKDAELFEEARSVGARLLWLHTYGERFVPAGMEPGKIPPGSAHCAKVVPNDADDYPERFWYDGATRTLHVGKGMFGSVEPEIYEFEASGLRVVQSWLKYRMKEGAGRTSSPLDDIRPESWTGQFSAELLELLHVLEKTVQGYPAQQALLYKIVEGDCFQAKEFPMPPERMRNLIGAGTHGSLI